MNFLSKIVEFSLNNRILVFLFLGVFLFFSISSIPKFKMDAVPDVTNVQVQVITSAPALTPIEIEQYVTYQIEKAMTGLPDLEEIRSISRYGLSVVTVVFKDSVSIYKARQLVAERMKEATENIPKGYGTPFMGPISSALGEVFQFTLESSEHSAIELTTYLNYEIAPILKTVKGIIEVNAFGGKTMQYQVKVDFQKASALGISLSDIWTAIQKNNSAMGGGYIEKQGEHYLISSSGLIKSTADLENIAVGRTKDGFPILLSQIATIQIGHKLRLGGTTANGKGEVVGAIAMMLLHENSLEVCENVKEKLKEIEKTLPKGMKIIPFYDRSVMVKTTIKTVIKNLLEGAILVITILFLFLGSIRSGLIIAIIIPLAMLFAIFLMTLREESGNLMSLGAIDFGLIVDGAVIIIENSTRRLSLFRKEFGRIPTQEEKLHVIQDATLEVRKATIFGEMIIAIVYFPILSLSGIEGKMFKPMAITVLYALSGAFIFSLCVIPVLAYYFLEIPDKEEHDTKFFEVSIQIYKKIFNKVFHRTREILVTFIVLILLTASLFYTIGGEFLPDLDEGSLLIEIGRLPSTALSESMKIATQIEELFLKEFSEIVKVVSRTGAPDIATDPMGIERTDSYFLMKPRDEWNMSRKEIISKMEVLMEENFPEVAYSISQPIQMRTNELLAGIRSDVGIKIYGENLENIKQLSFEISNLVRNIEGVKDIRIEQLQGLNYLKIIPKRESLARFGLSTQELNEIVQTLAVGLPVDFILEGRKKFEIVLLANQAYTNPKEIEQIHITNANKVSIPLGDVATVIYDTGPAIISHQNTYRRTLVEFNIRGRDMLSVIQDVNNKIQKNISFPVGYRYDIEGKYKNYLSARNTLMIVIPITPV
ncbi:MAG: CusA/CzcA family heavy metal efflux RND transporter, partial [Leptospiraceae bacterium]|nr:CusA/CzcA family heavy metal efflux RND transporter [Leptospiraceae bacterium]